MAQSAAPARRVDRGGLATQLDPEVRRVRWTPWHGSGSALCQLNTVVGDLDGNVARILAAYDEAEAAGCDLAVFPELAITGYPPEDLVLKPGFVADNREALEKVAAAPGRCAAVVGFVDVGPRPLQRGRGVRRRRGRRHVPQAPAPELRRVRRAALLRAGRRRRSRCSRSPA